MMPVKEIKQWLDTLDDNSEIGVDEGGLCLREVNEGRMTDACCKIGGIPEEIENA